MPHSTDVDETEQWRKLLKNAIRQRINAKNISDAVKELAGETSVSSDKIVEILLDSRRGQVYDQDPLVMKYAEVLIDAKCITLSSFLLGMLQASFILKENIILPLPSANPQPTFEEKGLRLLTEVLSRQSYPGSNWKLHGLIFAITRWLHAASEHEVSQQIELGALHSISVTAMGMYEALGVLAYNVFAHERFKAIERQPWWKERRPQIVVELVKFDVNVLQMCQSQLTGHLQALTKLRPFLETGKDGKPILSRDTILSTVAEVPVARSRAGLFIWLTCTLYTQPWIDDSSVRNYLLVRYHDDAQSAALSLIIAAYDVLLNSTMGQGTPQLQRRARSFICNRLPLLLLSFISAMPVGGIDNCISVALASVELGPISPLGSTTAEAKEVIKKSKLHFLQACVLQGVLTEANATAIIITDQPFVALKTQRHSKAGLYNQCITNVTRLESIAQELDSMNGNIAAIARCIADLIATLCNSKDTVTLKSVCTILLKKLSLMEFVFQCVAPVEVTLPICQLLNEWSHDQDQTEYQPPYEEFAVILLFLSAVVHSHNLSQAELQLGGSDNFVAKALFGSIGNIAMSDLNEEQNKQLANWIQGLYATDERGETIGITDEVYSQCPPQAFYLLVPYLFEQTVLACKSKALDVSTLKDGLDFLLEPFLLPSLIEGLSWVAETSWTDVDDTNIRLTILDKLMRSSSSSQDIQNMHKAILSIVAKPLEASLQSLAETRPEKKKEAAKLLDILKPYLSQHRPLGQSTQAQLAAWSSPDIDLTTSIGNALSDVLSWVSSGNSSAGSKYTPCIVWAAAIVLGPRQVLDALLAEVRQQSSTGDVSTILDICTAVVCSPAPSSHRPSPNSVNVNTLSLLDHIRLLVADSDVLLDMPFKSAEALIRLSRSVESQSTISPLASQLDLLNMSLPTDTTDQVMQDLGLAADNASLDEAAVAVINSSLTGDFDADAFNLTADQTLDLNKTVGTDLTDSSLMNIDQDNIFDLGMNLNGSTGLLGGAGASSALETTAEEDIFGDLDMIGGDFDFT